jgi:hypothetical protein
MTRDDFMRWFLANDWVLYEPTPHSLVFRSVKDMPEGLQREARIHLGFADHELEIRVVAFNGECRRLHTPRTLTIHDEDDLAWMVAQCGPKSFGHVIEALARVVGLPRRDSAA